MSNNCSGLGARLKEMRKKRNYNIKELSAILDISESYLGLLESDNRRPSLSLLTQMSVQLGASLDYLLFGETPESTLDISMFSSDGNDIRDFYPGNNWLDVDKETAFGLAIGKSLKSYRLNDEAFSYIFAVLRNIVWKMEKSGSIGKGSDNQEE